MKKKQDIFSTKLKLTKTEKRQHQNLMKVAETVSLHWILIQRAVHSFYSTLISLGVLILPRKQLRKKLLEQVFKFSKNFWWYLITPIIYQIIIDQASFNAAISTL